MFIIVLLAMLATSACAVKNNLYYWAGFHKNGGDMGYEMHYYDETRYIEHGKALIPYGQLELQYFVPAEKKAYVLQEAKKMQKSAPSAWPVVLSEDACYYAGKIMARGKFTTEHEWNGSNDDGVKYRFYGSTQRSAIWTFIAGDETKKLLFLQRVYGLALVMAKKTDKWATICNSKKCTYKGLKIGSGTFTCGSKPCPNGDCCKDKTCCQEKEICAIDGSCKLPEKCEMTPTCALGALSKCMFANCAAGSDGDRCCQYYCGGAPWTVTCFNTTSVTDGLDLHTCYCSCNCDAEGSCRGGQSGDKRLYKCSAPSATLKALPAGVTEKVRVWN